MFGCTGQSSRVGQTLIPGRKSGVEVAGETATGAQQAEAQEAVVVTTDGLGKQDGRRSRTRRRPLERVWVSWTKSEGEERVGNEKKRER